MMTNLFTIFDPTTSSHTSYNWMSLWSFLFFLPPYFWYTFSRPMVATNKTQTTVLSEFKNISTQTPESLLIVATVFTLITFLNLSGLLPFTFTNFSHMSNTLALAGPLWLGVFVYAWANNTSNSLVHLIPNGTPSVLMPFMVVIETVSTIIRPLTLAIRLAANMIAGHLLISLLMSATASAPIVALLPLFLGQVSLMGLEIAVAMIQAYVFSVLITLYLAECTN